ncbi:MAG: hypothetical protein ABWY08_13650 [Comamonas sp.]
MQIYWALWAGVLAVAMAAATWIEYNGIVRRIDGANGFILLMVGITCAMSLPLGGAVAWYFADFATAAKVVLITGAGLGAAFWLSLHWLGARARQR